MLELTIIDPLKYPLRALHYLQYLIITAFL